MLPFDRLVEAMDSWAKEHTEATVFAQVGESKVQVRHMECRRMVTPAEYRQRFEWADLVVSHVGMGTVITAVEVGKPLVLIARRPELNEVTSAHQIATAAWLVGCGGLRIVSECHELPAAIAECAGMGALENIESGTRPRLIQAIRDFISS